MIDFKQVTPKMMAYLYKSKKSINQRPGMRKALWNIHEVISKVAPSDAMIRAKYNHNQSTASQSFSIFGMPICRTKNGEVYLYEEEIECCHYLPFSLEKISIFLSKFGHKGEPIKISQALMEDTEIRLLNTRSIF